VIDKEGFRPNVGIVLANADGRVFWGKRIGRDAWQFPQGGIHQDETPEQALFRELEEEIGLRPEHVRVLGCTRGWLRYRLPQRFVRRYRRPVCIGQKQKWFFLTLQAPESCLRFDTTDTPEFEGWRWVDYWQPVREVIFFKQCVYRRALQELADCREKLHDAEPFAAALPVQGRRV
jgi:putative (di)nucleoside polyphosphate hydrolase